MTNMRFFQFPGWLPLMLTASSVALLATSFPGSSPTSHSLASQGRVGQNPENEVGLPAR